jgi:hypothetical protein
MPLLEAQQRAHQVELAAHDWSVRAPFPEVVAYLREVLTPRLTAFLGGVQETRATREWAEGDREPSADVQARMRVAAHVARTVVTVFDDRTLQAWAQGMDPMLEDASPLWMLVHRSGEDDRRKVVQAARRFITQ